MSDLIESHRQQFHVDIQNSLVLESSECFHRYVRVVLIFTSDITQKSKFMKTFLADPKLIHKALKYYGKFLINTISNVGKMRKVLIP